MSQVGLVRQEERPDRGTPVLELKNLYVSFETYAGEVKALNGINLTLYKGEVMGLVGESGCGKSVTAAAVVGLLPENGKVASGDIVFLGEDLLKKSKKEVRELRSTKIAMVFQDPMTFLNPVLTIGEQLREVFSINKQKLAQAALDYDLAQLKEEGANATDDSKRAEIRARINNLEGQRGNPPVPRGRHKRKVLDALASEALDRMRVPDSERIIKEFPHELSGGMRQRVMIAMAIARDPDLLIADEITTALDVTIQAQILELLKILRREFNSTILIITHDLGVVADLCDRVAVMYAGDVVEVADAESLYGKPLHPYTQGLLRAVPKLTANPALLESIPGSVPDLIYPPPACRFNPRCPFAWDLCKQKKPDLVEIEKGHLAACHLYTEGAKRPTPS
ncbi:MAG TPA: ABC transporter ATP-binding protein [Nitrososphaerales archaeon]|nr:ABC transporter ATP-binding protein [Nitrososphaerales archaeon]